MAREFFSGGMMPSHQLLLYFQDDLKIEATWRLSGTHYEKTSLAWLKNMDDNRSSILKIFEKTYGERKCRCLVSKMENIFSCRVKNYLVTILVKNGAFPIIGLLRVK